MSENLWSNQEMMFGQTETSWIIMVHRYITNFENMEFKSTSFSRLDLRIDQIVKYRSHILDSHGYQPCAQPHAFIPDKPATDSTSWRTPNLATVNSLQGTPVHPSNLYFKTCLNYSSTSKKSRGEPKNMSVSHPWMLLINHLQWQPSKVRSRRVVEVLVYGEPLLPWQLSYRKFGLNRGGKKRTKQYLKHKPSGRCVSQHAIPPSTHQPVWELPVLVHNLNIELALTGHPILTALWRHFSM